ncbi:holin [Vibrio phage KIT04]|nr:holin [Vibrio phage KIT04]
MNKDILSALLNALFTHIKDAKSLALYSVTMFIALISFLVITNQGEILTFTKNFSRNTIIEQVRAEQVTSYPKVAKERASMLYTQANSDAVFIAEYKPKFVNNYQDIIAWEGGVTVNPANMLNNVLDRTSIVYQQHVTGHNVAYNFTSDVSWSADNFLTSGREYKTIGIKYLYTCPIFDLDNSYSGYVGIGYTTTPYTNLEEKKMLEDYLERVCNPHARALGRKK